MKCRWCNMGEFDDDIKARDPEYCEWVTVGKRDVAPAGDYHRGCLVSARELAQRFLDVLPKKRARH